MAKLRRWLCRAQTPGQEHQIELSRNGIRILVVPVEPLFQAAVLIGELAKGNALVDTLHGIGLKFRTVLRPPPPSGQAKHDEGQGTKAQYDQHCAHPAIQNWLHNIYAQPWLPT
ncbi:MAG: hypothetical protein SGI99_04365 [Pseudomonadota bacterium]|nr:hypothetical protein [Pseudomonadota bacterium]